MVPGTYERKKVRVPSGILTPSLYPPLYCTRRDLRTFPAEGRFCPNATATRAARLIKMSFMVLVWMMVGS